MAAPVLANLSDLSTQTQRGEIKITYDITDLDETLCELLIQYSINNGVTWHNCTISEDPAKTDGVVNNAVPNGSPQISGLTTSAMEWLEKKVAWISHADLPNMQYENVLLKIRGNG